MNEIRYKHNTKIHNNDNALEILPFVFDYLNVHSIIDIGCGNGSWLDGAKKLGVNNIIGVDGIELPESELLISKSSFVLHDFKNPLDLNRRFDLVISLEVAEHLEEEYADNFIDILTKHGDAILFSAAIPGQGGQYHYNEKWPNYWFDKFKKRGYLAYDIIRPKFWDNPRIFVWYKQNTILYAKTGVIEKNDLTHNDTILSLVHPNIYKRKIYKAKYLKSKKEIYLRLIDTLKVYIKRLIKK